MEIRYLSYQGKRDKEFVISIVDTLTHEGFKFTILSKEYREPVSEQFSSLDAAKWWLRSNRDKALRKLFDKKFEENVLVNK